MPLQRRLPKRGFKNPFRKEYNIINVRDLARFPAGTVVDLAALKASGLVKRGYWGVKVLGRGNSRPASDGAGPSLQPGGKE